METNGAGITECNRRVKMVAAVKSSKQRNHCCDESNKKVRFLNWLRTC